jgi:SAM-dependent methyltransferase
MNCGLVFTIHSADSNDAYDLEYFADGGYRSYFARAPQWRYEAQWRLRWLLDATRPRTLLEIGCAGGFFLEAARRGGIAARGVEVSEVAARYAQLTLGVQVTIGHFEQANLEGPFDAVCAFHVLEHVDDPRGFLEKARELIAPRSCLALEVPNIESAAARADGIGWPGLQPEYHRWHFSPTTLTSLVESCGFGIDRCDTIYAAHYQRPGRRLLRAAITGRRPLETEHPSLGDQIRLLAKVIS